MDHPPRPMRKLAGKALAVLAAFASAVAAQDAGKGARLRAMRAVADEVKVEAVDDRRRATLGRIEDPIYRFDDPTRSTGDGTVWAWGRSGRPAALLTVASEKSPTEGERWLCEWTSLSAGSDLAVVGPNARAWEPSTPGAGPRPFPKAPAPAETAAARSRQLGELARRFRASEFFRPPDGNQTNRYELRLLPRPALRYADPGAGLVDGGLFFFVFGTNPEIALLIEARRDGRAPAAWTYGLARIAGAELHAELDGAEVWDQPVQFSPTARDPYFVIVRPMQADE